MNKNKIVDLFDVENLSHIKAFRFLEKNGFWPNNFWPDDAIFDSMDSIHIYIKMAKKYMSTFNENKKE